MVGEIIAGAVQGVAQGMAPGVMEAGMAATRVTAITATEVAAPVTNVITQGVQTGIETASEVAQASNAGVAAVSQVASSIQQVSESVGAVQQELGTSLVAESMAESLVGNVEGTQALAAQMEGLLSESTDVEALMTGLGEGLVTGQEFVPTQTLVEEAQKMTDFSPEKVVEIFSAVDMKDIPQEMLEDTAFREEVAQNLFTEARAQKEQVTQKKAVSEMMERSVDAAKKNHAQRKEPNNSKKDDEKELEKLKKKAALEAVRRQMEQWRQSVMADKRLSDDARAIALRKVDNVEKRLLLQTQMQWDGKSLLKMIAVVALYLSE